jgi:hypothetical protein
VLFAGSLAVPIAAQPAPDADFTITAEERKEAIEGSIARLKEAYVFPKVAAEMEKAVRGRMAKGEYDGITSGKELAAKLTEDFRAVSHDRHLNVSARAEGLPDDFGVEKPPTPDEIARFRAFGSRINYGFEKVERLQGNVGYVDIRGFAPPEFGGETASAAMNFVANSDALIVDLRKNNGGEPAMIAYVSSYLFDQPTHLNDIYTEITKSTQQWWTLPFVPGPKFGGKKPVFVLTSSRTFSGGEEFANNIKVLKRGTIIGETTGGGAHPVQGYRASKRFAIGVPFARAVNPITGTNWEGTGVAPDIAMAADQAFDHAYKLALEGLLAKAENPRQKEQLQKLLQERGK